MPRGASSTSTSTTGAKPLPAPSLIHKCERVVPPLFLRELESCRDAHVELQERIAALDDEVTASFIAATLREVHREAAEGGKGGGGRGEGEGEGGPFTGRAWLLPLAAAAALGGVAIALFRSRRGA